MAVVLGVKIKRTSVMTHKIALLFVNLECVKDTGESGNDEIYFKIWTDDQWYSNYPLHPENGDVFKMTHKDNMRQVPISPTSQI